MEFESPVKKKKRKIAKGVPKPTKCLIHIVSSEKDTDLSAFNEQSWKVRGCIYRYLKLNETTYYTALLSHAC